MIVMKFGGSSVANRAQIEKVLSIVEGRAARAPLCVCSAHKGITDALVGAAREAARGVLAASAVLDRQRAVARDLGCEDDLLAPFFAEISDLYRGISLVRELSPRSLDYVSSFGERMSARVIADFFRRRGLRAEAFDVWDLGFVTDASFGAARPLPGWEAAARRLVAERVPPGVVPIVTGFVGRTEAGEITTVGRNGSDLTATLLGAALGAEEVEIWSDTDGVMTADPSVVKAARSIPSMRFDEAAELAYFGSRVLHPSTLLPAMEKSIPVRVLNTNRPDHPGTVIHHDIGFDGEPGRGSPNPSGAHPGGAGSATSIAYKEGQIVATITSTRMFGEAGFLGRVFEILGRHGVVVDMVATSEICVSFTTDRRERLDRALADLGAIGDVRVEGEKTLLVVVGRHLAERAGLGAAILQAVADAGVNVEMVSYGMKSISLTMLIADQDIGRAVGVLHRRLFEEAPRVLVQDRRVVPFHLAFPVKSLDEARAFYGTLLGCPEGRSSDEWVDFDLHGHQIVAHLAPDQCTPTATHGVDGDAVPVRHFGLVLTMDAWHALAGRLRAAGVAFLVEPHVRFQGQVGEQATMFFLDPSGNALEMKAFADPARLFAR